MTLYHQVTIKRTGSGLTGSAGSSKHQRAAGGPLHLEQVGVRDPDRQNRVSLQQRVDLDQTLGTGADKQVPVNWSEVRAGLSPTQVRVGGSDLWKGEQWMEWTGPLLGLNEKTAGALKTRVRSSGGTAAGVWEEKEHRSSRPPSEPIRNRSGSHGDRARAVTPTVPLPRTCVPNRTIRTTNRRTRSSTVLRLTLVLVLWGTCCCMRAYAESRTSLVRSRSRVHSRTLPPELELRTPKCPFLCRETQET